MRSRASPSPSAGGRILRQRSMAEIRIPDIHMYCTYTISRTTYVYDEKAILFFTTTAASARLVYLVV
jgi:hypothetical protein